MTVNATATLLGVNRTTFWRFHETGEALSSTRARIREALAKRIVFAESRVADEAVDPVGVDASRQQERRSPQGGLADCELKQIRKVCESVLALLNVYEAQQSLVRKI